MNDLFIYIMDNETDSSHGGVYDGTPWADTIYRPPVTKIPRHIQNLLTYSYETH